MKHAPHERVFVFMSDDARLVMWSKDLLSRPRENLTI